MVTIVVYRTTQGRFVRQTEHAHARVLADFLVHDIGHMADFFRALLSTPIAETVLLESCQAHISSDLFIIEPTDTSKPTLNIDKKYAYELLELWEQYIFSGQRQCTITLDERRLHSTPQLLHPTLTDMPYS
ncbi:MAG: hypothetical protein WCE21_05750 [Candidatus Babeliales bacterium]